MALNIAELANRLNMVEKLLQRVFPAETVIPGINNSQGIQLIGVTTAERTALGTVLLLLPLVRHIFVFDTTVSTGYVWNGAVWVQLAGGGQISSDITREIPAGTVNGSNDVFILSQSYTEIILFVNGVKYVAGVHYSLSSMTITFLSGYIPETGYLLEVYGIGASITPGFSTEGIVREVPSGVINGSNPTFTLSQSYSLVILFFNSIKYVPGVHYTLSGTTITFLSGFIPETGDLIEAYCI